MVADLKGRVLPDIELPSTQGGTVNPARVAAAVVYFIYPWTGRPDHENPAGWDDIEGAHGSTPQIRAYHGLRSQFGLMNAAVFGVSSLRPAWQRDFAERNGLRQALLSDEQERFSNALGLEWFRAGARAFLKRRTLIAHNGVIIMDRQTIQHPEDDAGQTLALLRVLMKK
jgi:peroxiredoxin